LTTELRGELQPNLSRIHKTVTVVSTDCKGEKYNQINLAYAVIEHFKILSNQLGASKWLTYS